MKHQKDTAVRCVYIALRWSAVPSARFSIDILLRWSKETFWHRTAWCVFCRSECFCLGISCRSRVFSGINQGSRDREFLQGSRVKLAPTGRGRFDKMFTHPVGWCSMRFKKMLVTPTQPTLNDGWEANKHKPSSYPMVI